MWIFDSYYKGTVELWGREGRLSRLSVSYPPSFFMHLKDPSAHRATIGALENIFRVEEHNFKTIFGPLQGYKIYADKKVART